MSGDILRIDTAGGDYQFLRCGGNGFTLDGRGELLRAGCVLALVDAKVIAVVNHCPVASPDRCHAIVRVSPLGSTFLVNDRDVNSGDCVCR